MFTSQPQAVEVYQAGAWWAGELLGWRHDTTGSCEVWVRVVLGGVEETAWTDLASLRLPERHLAVATEPAAGPGAAYAPRTQEMSVARHPSGRRARSGDGEGPLTAGRPMVRDLSVVPDLPSRGGRRTADETAQFASVGRRRAPDTAALPSGGRRRAPEAAESPSVGRRRAPEAAPMTSPSAASSGRHRAPADAGRHRTVDTGLFPVVSEAAPQGATRLSAPRPANASALGRPRVPVPRPEEPAARSGAGWAAPEGLEPELLTRPMRLSDHVPHARRPRVDDSLRGV